MIGSAGVALVLALALVAIFATQLLNVIGLALAGGLLLMWVSWKLFRETRRAMKERAGEQVQLHLDDNLRADAQGAHQAGMQPLWLQRQGASHPDYPVIQDLHGVLTWLAAHGT